MSNNITGQYFHSINLAHRSQEILRAIVAQTDFNPKKEIFRGQVYDDNKVGSLIYQGTWKKKSAVLKIQGLHPEVDEIDIIEKFNQQNKSEKIRLPKLYHGLKWNEHNGYGYLLLEHIDAPKIYQSPFANPEQMEEFCALYQEYKTQCLQKPFIEQKLSEKSSLIFTTERIAHWIQVAQAKKQFSQTEIPTLETFLSLAGIHLPSLKMQWMHGHFTYDDIFKISHNEYVLMSNLFWSYRPEYYDAVFHLWAGIKSLRDSSITLEQIREYIEQWIEAYEKVPVIINDADFKRKFYIMLAERCIGALLVDIQNQHYSRDRVHTVAFLTQRFQGLFQHLANTL